MSPPAGVVDGLLAGRYRLASLLGSGANGEVWRARDERLGRDVAVKVLRPELADDATVRARFRVEARSAGRLRHPGVAAVFDFAEQDDSAWLVMELVEGQPLSAVLRREGPLSVDHTLDVVEQAAAGLQAAHDSGVVHRDVKPGNLLLRPDGRLSVTDFGIAYAAGAAALTRTGQVVGTAAYLSPEQAQGQPVTPATDLYSLGVVAHECLSGARPFERDDPVALLLAHLHTAPPPLPDDVPGPVADLVHRLMAKDPADRPASARQVQQEAAALRRGLPVPAPVTVAPAAPTPAQGVRPDPRTAPLSLAGRPGQRRAVRAIAVALGLLALALGARDALDPGAGSSPDVQPERPMSSAPPVPAVTSDPPAVSPQDEQQPQDTPVVLPEDDGGEQEQDEPPQDQQGGQGQEQQQEREREQEKAQQEREREQEKAQQERVREQEKAQQERDRERQQERDREDQGRGGGG